MGYELRTLRREIYRFQPRLTGRVGLFVSYSVKDFEPYLRTGESRAGQIYEIIGSELDIRSPLSRFHILQDAENCIEVGEYNMEEIGEAIRQADCALVFLSIRYLESEYCRHEFLEFARLDKPIFLAELENVEAVRRVVEKGDLRLADIKRIVFRCAPSRGNLVLHRCR